MLNNEVNKNNYNTTPFKKYIDDQITRNDKAK